MNIKIEYDKEIDEAFISNNNKSIPIDRTEVARIETILEALEIPYTESWRKSGRTRGIRMKKKLKFFTYGFYIGAVLWACGLVASLIVENITMKILLILIPLAIYWFFIIGKSIIEEKIKKNSQHRGGKRNLECALYK